MSEFITVGHLPDGKNIRLQKDWDKEFSWYVILRTEMVKTSTDSIILEKDDNYDILEFIDIEADCLKFINIKTGACVIIDPCIDLTRNTISIYSIDKYDYNPDCELMAHKIEWYDIQGMTFDTNFFKEGHAYKIKVAFSAGGHRYWVNALLKKITCDYLEFAYINPIGSLISSYTIPVNTYKVRKKKEWYIALNPDDKWSDELEE